MSVFRKYFTRPNGQPSGHDRLHEARLKDKYEQTEYSNLILPDDSLPLFYTGFGGGIMKSWKVGEMKAKENYKIYSKGFRKCNSKSPTNLNPRPKIDDQVDNLKKATYNCQQSISEILIMEELQDNFLKCHSYPSSRRDSGNDSLWSSVNSELSNGAGLPELRSTTSSSCPNSLSLSNFSSPCSSIGSMLEQGQPRTNEDQTIYPWKNKCKIPLTKTTKENLKFYNCKIYETNSKIKVKNDLVITHCQIPKNFNNFEEIYLEKSKNEVIYKNLATESSCSKTTTSKSSYLLLAKEMNSENSKSGKIVSSF